jgi:hypothetical protein
MSVLLLFYWNPAGFNYLHRLEKHLVPADVSGEMSSKKPPAELAKRPSQLVRFAVHYACRDKYSWMLAK